jgi:hypothetical protein
MIKGGIVEPFYRQTINLLRKLVEPSSYAIWDGERGGRLLVYSPRNNFSKPVAGAEGELACSLRRSDLLEEGARPDALVLSATGRAALKRALASADPFREQHEARAVKVADEDGRKRKLTVNEAESPLAWLRSRSGRDGKPLIEDAQFKAGERLRADFTRAQMGPRVTQNWDALASSRRERRGAPGQGDSLTDSALAARLRVEQALDFVGPDFASLLLDVCCFLKGIEDAEKNNSLPQRSGKVVLKFALNALARHYGLAAAQCRPSRSGTLHHWGSPDYRPVLSPDGSVAAE